MKVAELKKGMLLESCSGAYFHLNTTFLTNDGEKILTARWDKGPRSYSKEPINTIMYLGAREDLMLKKKNYWGKQYALVEGDIAVVDSASWQYIQPTCK